MKTLLRKIIDAPAPDWLLRIYLRQVSRRLHGCANDCLKYGDYQTAVEIRTIAHRVDDQANAI